ncbi:glycosyltransferase family A protein [Seonamhaeicola marinus]|uniref:Glycosyltransferase family 2 protein n=1 Tax=Seonamhaeicola marinus TaxID=1912246 RepID=A0A5D0HJK3_9FLAO|nr:glycosyltransferase family A protein [Seonamhaeicola marinus]TYA71415.1 glycosyltransferase family 2 protein [Seonamhaeicola marinus]
MNKEPLLSIIVPCYNDVEYIEQAIDSVINQTYSNKEIIIVDDGSNAETKLVLKKLESKINQLITQENKGQSTARNIGIEEAKGVYILVLDSDDYFEPTFCEKAVNTFLDYSRVKLVTCYSNLIYENKRKGVFKPSGGTLKDVLKKNVAMGSAMFKKSDWSYVEGYDEMMRRGFEDWEFYIRLLARGGEAFVLKESLFNYRKRQNSTTSKANRNKYDLLTYIYIKHKELYIEHFEGFVKHLLSRIEREEHEKTKNTLRLEYRIGYTILKPLRWVKKLLK